MKKYPLYKIVLFFLLSGTGIVPKLMAQKDSMMMVKPIETDRPFQSGSATLIPKGYFQMETGFSIEDTDPGFLYTYPSSVIKIGINNNVEVRVMAQYINIQQALKADVGGMLPVWAGLKTKLLDQHGIVPKAAFTAMLSLPGIASKQFATTYFASDMGLSFRHDISEMFSIQYRVGVHWNGEDPRPSFNYAFGTGTHIIHRLGIFIEAYGDVPQQRENDFRHRLDGGFTFLIGRDVLLDASGGIGLSKNATERFIGGGLSYRFKM